MSTERINPWREFKGENWQNSIKVSEFINENYTPYEGDSSFLKPATQKTKNIWASIEEKFPEERKKGVYDVDYSTPSTITSHKPGYINEQDDIIVGLQTDAPLKRAIMPNGGWRMVKTSLQTYNYPVDENLENIYTKYRKTHNDTVFDLYTPDIRAARSAHIITGLPDAYGRGRIIGDYRRVALYGTDFLIKQKTKDKEWLYQQTPTADTLQEREEHAEQIKALKELTQMAASYGFDITQPAKNFKEATQWLYLAYLAATKEQNGAAMSLGRTSTFLDIYAERDLKEKTLNETQIQEIIDNLIIKLRIIRFLRTPEYDELFSGDPTWVTESLAGTNHKHEHMVTKTSYRYLHTLYNLGPAPEPNLTVLWDKNLPENFKKYCAQVSIDTSSIQYENDELIQEQCGEDSSIACCVSPMQTGKEMQFFGARVNIAKALLYALNEGKDENTGKKIIPNIPPLKNKETLQLPEVWDNYLKTLDWLAKTYVEALNCIHYSHDKNAYERLQMALHDRKVERNLACGAAGLSVAADSLSAIQYAKVHPIYNPETGLITDYKIEGEFPHYGNDNDQVDDLAAMITSAFMNKIRKYPTYRNARHTMSLLTITSNIVYGSATGNTPDGRKAGTPFSPGANPMNGRDTHGMLSSMLSVTKLPYADAQDGISLTNTIMPSALGNIKEERAGNLSRMLDAGFKSGLYHANINVLHPEILKDAIENPEKYPNLVVRVSGYAVNLNNLSHTQKMDLLSRTMHTS